MARKFLYLIAAIILVIFGFGVAYQLNPGWFGRVAFVPSTQFVEQAAAAPNAYDDPAMWFARPGLADDPADWRPPVEGQKEAVAAKAEGKDYSLASAQTLVLIVLMILLTFFQFRFVEKRVTY